MANRHLTCIECGVVSDGDARGWIGRRYDDPETDRRPELVFYCSSCTVREFGGDTSAKRWMTRDGSALTAQTTGRNAAFRRTALAG
jgi:hypothetical protein